MSAGSDENSMKSFTLEGRYIDNQTKQGIKVSYGLYCYILWKIHT